MAEEDADIIKEYEELFKDRYTELDVEFQKEISKPVSPPPCVMNWFTKRRNDWGRGGRGGGRGRGGYNSYNDRQGNWGHRGNYGHHGNHGGGHYRGGHGGGHYGRGRGGGYYRDEGHYQRSYGDRYNDRPYR